MQKNKFIHEDINAVCNSTAKKLIAAGLIAATTVGGANFASNNCKNIACAQLPEGNELNKPEEKKLCQLTEEEEMEVIAQGLGNYSSWHDLCADNNFAYGPLFFEADANRIMSLMNARTDEIAETLEKSKEEFEKQKEEIKELQIEISEQTRQISKIKTSKLAYYEHDPRTGRWEFTLDHYLNIDEASLQRFSNLPKETTDAAYDAFALRHKLDYLRELIRGYNSRLRYNQVEASLQPQSPEPDRYDIELAPEYVEWATREVNRLEALARVMLRQLRVGAQEQTDFEDRMRWLTPETDCELFHFMEEGYSLDDYFSYRHTSDLSRENVKFLELDEVVMKELNSPIGRPWLTEAEHKDLMDVYYNFGKPGFNETKYRALMDAYHKTGRPTLTGRDEVEKTEDLNMINNNQIDIDDSVTITREEFERNMRGEQIVERPEHNNPIDDCQMQNDNNMINNNQVEEHNPENNNQRQQQTLNIAPLNLPVQPMIHETLNQPTPQQGNGIVRGTINFVGNVLSFLNPFAKK